MGVSRTYRGGFNAQLTPLDTNGSTVNRWNWLSSLIEDKREGVDSFRSKHQNTLQFTRYRSTLLPCDTHIDLFLLSSRLLMLPFLTLDSADICVQDKTSDHHPIHCALQLPCTPQYPPPPPQHTLFRRLTQAEIREFTSKLSPLEEWAKNIPMDQVSLGECVQWMNTVTQQVANAYHGITRPSAQHRETRMEREFKQALASVPSTTEGRKKTLRKLQDLNERWTKKRTEKEKKRLHYCLIKGRKIKKAVDQALNPQQRTQVHLWDESTDPPNLATEPPQVGRVFSECLSKLGGEPDFEVPDQLLDQFISHIPKCPADVGAQPLPLPELSLLRSTTARASPSKATGEDEVNYYVISLCPEHLQAFILSAIHLVLRHGPPPQWAKARVCLLYKKGDPKKASNYRPICLIQSIVKLASVWQCQALTKLTANHRLIHPCQHGGLKNHRCGDHIYDLVSRMLQSKGRLYHLYVDFNKAFNSVPLKALWRTLRGYGLPDELISSIQRLYTHAFEQPLVYGIATAGHYQKRGVRQGCPLTPLLFVLYLNLMFYYLDTKIEWGLDKSIHAFIDDILFRARSLADIQVVFEAFDGPARQLGLDMNVEKTELHMLRGSQHAVVQSVHGGRVSTRDTAGRPHSVYKYLGVYFDTTDHATRVWEFVRAEINSFFAHLAPLQLTASELISLVNKQLIPTMAYRLMAGPITDAQLVKLQHLIWNNIAVFGKLPRRISPKDRYHSRSSPCFGLGLMPFRMFMHSQVYKYSIGYLNNEGPPQSNHWVRRALTDKRANWLQNSFVDSVQALGGRCHGFGPWNPCKVADLHPGETVYVECNSGWHDGTVLHDPTPNYAVVQFHIGNTLFHIKDAIHNFSVHVPPQPDPAGPEPALHLSIPPPLLYLPPPLPPYAIPYRSTQVGSNSFGHLFRCPEEIPLPQVSALAAWGCVSVRDAVEHAQADSWLWEKRL